MFQLKQLRERASKSSGLNWFQTHDLYVFRAGDRFSKCPDNFSGRKSNIQIEIKRIRGRARVLASKTLHFVPLTDSFIMLDAKLLKRLSCM